MRISDWSSDVCSSCLLSAEKDVVTLTWSTQGKGKETDFNAHPGDIGYRTSDVFYHNAQVAFQFLDNSRFYVGVDNLFDKDAPYIQSFTDANTDTMTYDLLGRRFYACILHLFLRSDAHTSELHSLIL